MGTAGGTWLQLFLWCSTTSSLSGQSTAITLRWISPSFLGYLLQVSLSTQATVRARGKHPWDFTVLPYGNENHETALQHKRDLHFQEISCWLEKMLSWVRCIFHSVPLAPQEPWLWANQFAKQCKVYLTIMTVYGCLLRAMHIIRALSLCLCYRWEMETEKLTSIQGSIADKWSRLGSRPSRYTWIQWLLKLWLMKIQNSTSAFILIFRGLILQWLFVTSWFLKHIISYWPTWEIFISLTFTPNHP